MNDLAACLVLILVLGLLLVILGKPVSEGFSGGGPQRCDIHSPCPGFLKCINGFCAKTDPAPLVEKQPVELLPPGSPAPYFQIFRIIYRMKKFAIKTITWYAIVALLVAVALLPILKASAPEYFPSISGFRDLDCKGVTCGEGQFCQSNKCVSVNAPNPLGVPEGNQ